MNFLKQAQQDLYINQSSRNIEPVKPDFPLTLLTLALYCSQDSFSWPNPSSRPSPATLCGAAEVAQAFDSSPTQMGWALEDHDFQCSLMAKHVFKTLDQAKADKASGLGQASTAGVSSGTSFSLNCSWNKKGNKKLRSAFTDGKQHVLKTLDREALAWKTSQLELLA